MKRPEQASGGSAQGWPELKKRLLFILLGLVIFRMGAHIPVPGVDILRLTDLFSQHQTGILGLFNMFSGGALSRFTLFALGVMPYISSSIIMQLVGVVVPYFERLKKEGEAGKRQLNQYTRYGTLMLALFQAFGVSKWLAAQHIVWVANWQFYLTASLTLSAGAMFLMWLGEQMTERGIGNGISLLIFAGIVSRLPSAFVQVMTQVREGQLHVFSLLILLVLIVCVIGFVVFMERGQRRISIHYSKRQQGRRMVSVQNTHLPLKINMSGVIPPIFASSIILLPATLAKWFSETKGMAWLSQVSLALSPGEPLYIILFSLAIICFCYLYTAMVFNPRETADQLKKSGGFIAGIRPGEHTARHIDKIMTRLTLVGALYLCFVALMPQFFIITWHVPFRFGGTSLLIVVVVVMDFIAQIQAHLMSGRYAKLLKKQGAGSLGLLRR